MALSAILEDEDYSIDCKYTSTPVEFWGVSHLVALVEEQNRRNKHLFTDQLVDELKSISGADLRRKLKTENWIQKFLKMATHEDIVRADIGLGFDQCGYIMTVLQTIESVQKTEAAEGEHGVFREWA